MIERLTYALQTLASPAEMQLSRFPELAARAGEIALDYADALRLVTDCPQILLTPEQMHALEQVDEQLDRMTRPDRAPLWTQGAVRGATEWALVRAAAARALEALGLPRGGPRPADAGRRARTT